MTELVRLSERRFNRPQSRENVCVQFGDRRQLATYSGLDVARRRIHLDVVRRWIQEQIVAGVQLFAEIGMSVSAAQVIVKFPTAGDYLAYQQLPLIGWIAKLGHLHQMPEDSILSAGQGITDGPAERVSYRNVRIRSRSCWQLCRLRLERGQGI